MYNRSTFSAFYNWHHWIIHGTNKEEWYSAGYIGYCKYEISSLGNIRNMKTKYVFLPQKSRIKRDGITLINMTEQTKTVLRYRVILSVFESLQIKLSPNLQTNHLNGKHYDQAPCNLEWVTGLENVKHAARIGLISRNTSPITLYSIANDDVIKFQSIKNTRNVLCANWDMNFNSSSVSKWCQSKRIVNGYRFIYDSSEKYLNTVSNILDDEVWKEIFPHCNEKISYHISNYGRIKSVHIYTEREKVLKQHAPNGYSRIILRLSGERKNFLVHRLVALCFLPNPNNYKFVNHIDSISTNKCASNLEWVKRANEFNLATHNKLKTKKRCVGHIAVEIEQICLQTGSIIKIWNSARDIHSGLCFYSAGILKCCRGQQKTSYGYKWKFI